MGSSPGFGSNPNNTPGLVETPHLGSAQIFPRSTWADPPEGGPSQRAQKHSSFLQQLCLRPIRALFGLAFAAAPELLFLNLAA